MRSKQLVDVETVCHWIKTNRGKWELLRHIVRKQIKAGHRVSRDTVFTIAMLEGMEISDTKEFKRDHNLWSVMARFMLMLEPGLWKGLRCKEAPIDTVDIETVWRENVNAGTTFLAHSWKEARELYLTQDVSAA